MKQLILGLMVGALSTVAAASDKTLYRCTYGNAFTTPSSYELIIYATASAKRHIRIIESGSGVSLLGDIQVGAPKQTASDYTYGNSKFQIKIGRKADSMGILKGVANGEFKGYEFNKAKFICSVPGKSEPKKN